MLTLADVIICPTSIAKPAPRPLVGGIGPGNSPVVLSGWGTAPTVRGVPWGDCSTILPPPPASWPEPFRGTTVFTGALPSSEVKPTPVDFTEFTSNVATV